MVVLKQELSSDPTACCVAALTCPPSTTTTSCPSSMPALVSFIVVPTAFPTAAPKALPSCCPLNWTNCSETRRLLSANNPLIISLVSFKALPRAAAVVAAIASKKGFRACCGLGATSRNSEDASRATTLPRVTPPTNASEFFVGLRPWSYSVTGVETAADADAALNDSKFSLAAAAAFSPAKASPLSMNTETLLRTRCAL
mmetsp:Transcript_11531/g.26105  ORF Transcript_11531/g.26105 Transcript_11531/m.26105 type:complete len:200 (-) Transcript_11531:479-1078(-)